ncbi:MAG TPA: PilZ domain-containing protein [Vicinamibacterales bacterium]|nr:PilZ domain-containing protein [Vicinamibacterales bacterium]
MSSSAKTILIAHRLPAVRERFAAALADARHAFVTADSEASARRAAADRAVPVSLALVDLGLTSDGVAFVRALKQEAGRPLPVVVFSGTVSSAAQIPKLLALGIGGYVNEHAATPQILPALAPHLFPDNFNRRASPRVALGVPVSYRSGQTIAGAVTLDVGKGGLAIRTMNPLAPGVEIQLKFRLPNAPEDIEAAGRVAWSDRKVGMGVQFERVTAADQAAIDAFIDLHAG